MSGVLRADRRLLSLAIALSGLAGFVDAVGFLSAGGFFVSFMSGNSTRLAVALGTDADGAWRAASLIGGFVIGVMLGGIMGHMAGRARRPAVLAMVTGLLTIGAIAGAAWPGLAIAAMVLAMGAENAALADNGEVRVGVTYMTGALVRLGNAAANRLCGRTAGAWHVDLGLWCGLTGGAIGGALAYAALHLAALWIAAALAAALTLAALAIGRPERAG